MPKVEVNGVGISYEVLGDEGPHIVLTSGGSRVDKEFMRPLADCLGAHHQVMIYDRRNSGESDLCFGQEQSELEDMADDLHELTQSIGWTAPYVGGCSNGSRIALIAGHRYLEHTRGLLLIWPPLYPEDSSDNVIKNGYLQCAEVAANEGMKALIANEDLGRHVNSTNPTAREQLLAMNPAAFARTMERCAELMPTDMRFGGLAEEEVRRTTAPSLLLPGFDGIHSLSAAELYSDLLPMAYVSNASDHLNPESAALLSTLRERKTNSRAELAEKFARAMTYDAPTIAGFVAGVEACARR